MSSAVVQPLSILPLLFCNEKIYCDCYDEADMLMMSKVEVHVANLDK